MLAVILQSLNFKIVVLPVKFELIIIIVIN